MIFPVPDSVVRRSALLIQMERSVICKTDAQHLIPLGFLVGKVNANCYSLGSHL